MRDARERLRDMIDAVDRVEQYAAQGRSVFASDELIQVWIVHHLQILGEAASQLGRDFHSAHPVVPWPQIVAMRNILVHDYFGIDLDQVWNVVANELPELKIALLDLLATLGPDRP